MTDEKALELFKEPEKIAGGEECNYIISYLTGRITDAEEELHERNFQVSVKHNALYEEHKTIAKADRQLELTDIYREREYLKLKLGQLRRYRQDLKDRLSILTNKYF